MRHIGPLSLMALTPLIPTVAFVLCRTLEKSPGSTRGPRLWAESSLQWSWARLSPGVQRKRPMGLPPVSESSRPGQVAIPIAQGLEGEKEIE